MHDRNKPGVLFIMLFLLLMGACTPQKRLHYFQPSDNKVIEQSLTVSSFEYRLQAGDVLMLQVVSRDEAVNKAFSRTESQMGTASVGQGFDGSSLSLSGYVLNDTGIIILPLVGRLKLSGLTIEEANVLVLKEISRYALDAFVSLKMVSYKVTILGEVRSPGIYRTYDNKLNLLDALGMAGDLTEFGNRQKINLIRQEGQNRQITYIDLTKSDVLASGQYHLRPNDVIYVPSLPAKSWGFANAITPITLTLSLISTTILLINFVK